MNTTDLQDLGLRVLTEYTKAQGARFNGTVAPAAIGGKVHALRDYAGLLSGKLTPTEWRRVFDITMHDASNSEETWAYASEYLATFRKLAGE